MKAPAGYRWWRSPAGNYCCFSKWYDPNTCEIGWLPMTDRDPLLAERQATHGSFPENAWVSQGIKTVMASASGYPRNEVYREALDMIALKISRICSGQANYKDHWDDIAGYAKLASEACDDPRKSA